jgi:Spy/CpxP family protein refolding chaperone
MEVRKNMKRLLAMFLSCIFAASVCAIAIADEQPAGKGEKMTIEQHQQKKLAQLTKALTLTADQQSKIADLMKARSEKMKGVKNNKDERKAIFDDYNTQVKAVLTPEQVTKYDKMMEKEKGKHEKHQEKQ